MLDPGGTAETLVMVMNIGVEGTAGVEVIVHTRVPEIPLMPRYGTAVQERPRPIGNRLEAPALYFQKSLRSVVETLEYLPAGTCQGSPAGI